MASTSAFDAIGHAKTTEQSIDAVKPGVTALRGGGTAVLVGLPYGPAASIPTWDILRGKTFTGTLAGHSRPDRDFPMYVRWFKEGRLPLDLLVTRRYKLDQINEAVDALREGRDRRTRHPRVLAPRSETMAWWYPTSRPISTKR